VLSYDGVKLPDGPKTIADLFDTQKFPGKRGLAEEPGDQPEFALQ
jgi:putative spermidine/putrescine transport system substrate-binding protein